MKSYQQFFAELKRRKVFRVMAGYGVIGFGIIEAAEAIFPRVGIPDWAITLVVWLTLLGFPIAVLLAWVFESTPGGVKRTEEATAAELDEIIAQPAARRWSAGLLALAGAALLFGGWWIGRQSAGPDGNDGAAQAEVAGNGLVVFPFTVRGGDEATVLGEGMVGLLGRKLDGVGDLVAVDPNTVIQRVSGTVDPAAARDVARDLGGAYYLLGSVLEFGGSLNLQASVYATAGDSAAVVEASVDGSVEDFQTLVDDLASRLVVDGELAPSGNMPRSAVLTTNEFPALKYFVEGERALRANQFGEAIDQFDRAIEVDSAFALAYYRKAIAAGWAERPELKQEAITLALRYADRLSSRDRERLAALEAGSAGRVAEARNRYEAILASHPADTESWYELGEVLLHTGAILGVPVVDAREPFARVAELDPEHGPALDHLSMIAAWTRDSTALDAVSVLMRDLPGSDYHLALEAQWALMVGDSADRARTLERVIEDSSSTALVYASWSTDDVAEVRRLIDAATRLPPQWDWILAGRLAGVGQRNAALDWIESRGANEPIGLLRTGLLATLTYLPPPAPPRLDDLRERLDRWDPGPVHAGPLTANDRRDLAVALPQGRTYVLGLIDHLQGRPAGALARADELEGMGGAEEIRMLAGDLAKHLRAEVAFATGRPAEALSLLEDMTVWETFLWDYRFSMLFTYAGPIMLRANALDELGRHREALRWYGTHSLATYPFGYAVYRSARSHEALGEAEQAAELYAQFIRRWAEADPELQVLVDDARERLEGLN